MYERILVPTDGSEPSAEAAEHAMDLASQYGAAVDALFVVDKVGPAGHWDMVVERQEETGERALDRVAGFGDEHGVTVERHLRRGSPSEEIVHAARDYEADLIVMGTQGLRGLDRLASAGSTTERVVRLTVIPVLVVGGAGVGEGDRTGL